MENFPLSPTSSTRAHNGHHSVSSRHSLSHSRSLLNDSNSSMGDVSDRGGAASAVSRHTHPHHPHHSHHHRNAHNTVLGPHDAASYGRPVEDNEEIYLATDIDNDSTLDKISLTLGLDRPLDHGDHQFLEQFGSLGSRMTTIPGPGSDVSSALAFLEDMWHEGYFCYYVTPTLLTLSNLFGSNEL